MSILSLRVIGRDECKRWRKSIELNHFGSVDERYYIRVLIALEQRYIF